MLDRQLLPRIDSRLDKGKVIILLGARQVGKTTLIKQLVGRYPTSSVLMLNGDDFEIQQLSKKTKDTIRQMVSGYKCVVVDEAHKVNRIGDIIKSLVDDLGAKVQFILTGSSSVNLLDQTSEPLTGRKRVFELFSFDLKEAPPQDLESRIIYGDYPEVYNADNPSDKQDAILELAESSLYRDVLDVTGARASGDLVALLVFLAQNIGQTISLNNIHTTLGIDRRTIDRYIDLLAKSYIVFPLMPYSKSQQSIRRSYKVYFWDTGVRNALLRDFRPLEARSDFKMLWQNYGISQRLKAAKHQGSLHSWYYWRSYDGAEIDLVESRPQGLVAYRLADDKQTLRSSKVFSALNPVQTIVVRPNQTYLLGEDIE